MSFQHRSEERMCRLSRRAYLARHESDERVLRKERWERPPAVHLLLLSPVAPVIQFRADAQEEDGRQNDVISQMESPRSEMRPQG